MSRRDDERVTDILDAASQIGDIIRIAREDWDKDRSLADPVPGKTARYEHQSRGTRIRAVKVYHRTDARVPSRSRAVDLVTVGARAD